MGISSAAWGRALLPCALALLAACDDPGRVPATDPGRVATTMQAEREPNAARPLYIVSAGHDRAIVSARGRRVTIKPSDGLCLVEDSVETSERSAFALIGDCVLERGRIDDPRDSRAALQLPRSVPGIITVSILGDPGLDGGVDSPDELGELLKAPEGWRMLRRSADGGPVLVVEIRRIGDGVYVLVWDDGAPLVPAPVLDQRFWRAFIELNDRLAVVTFSGFRDRPLGEDRMLEHLVDQVQTLAAANGESDDEDSKALIAQATDPRLVIWSNASIDEGIGEGARQLADSDLPIPVARRERRTDVILPPPNPRRRPPDARWGVAGGDADEARPAIGGPLPEGEAEDEDDRTATSLAPETAPAAPRR